MKETVQSSNKRRKSKSLFKIKPKHSRSYHEIESILFKQNLSEKFKEFGR